MSNLDNMKVTKRDGVETRFDLGKIALAVYKASGASGEHVVTSNVLDMVTEALGLIEETSVEAIEKLVEGSLYELGYEETANTYSAYRKERTKIRDAKSDLMKVVGKIGVVTDRDNANVGSNFASKLLRIASESNKQFNLAKMPKRFSRLHENLDIYTHDLDSFNLTSNCLHIDTGEVLRKSFNTGYGTLRVPKRIESAAELSCILLQSTQNELFGGQSHHNFDNDMAYFVALTREEILNEERKRLAIYNSKESINEKYVDELVEARTRQAMQIVVMNLNTMHARSGSQVPFSSVNLGLPDSEDAALVCKLFMKEYEKGMGKGESMIFPNIIFRVKTGVNRNAGDPYYYLFQIACRVAAKRMNPTFMSMDSSFNLPRYMTGKYPATMGCRTYLYSNINGEDGVAARGNNAPATINLPRLGILANRNVDRFFEILTERLIDTRDSLLYRHGVLCQLKVSDLPFVVGEGLMVGAEGLNPDDSIEPVLLNGTYGIGFTGLAETLTALIGSHHGETEEARELGLRIIKFIRKFTDDATQEYKLNFACYATPAEGLSGKFVPVDRRKYGRIKGVTDKDYYTNGFHVPVGYKVNMIDKIQIEAPYHALCNGGHISYVEVDGTPTAKNIENIVKYAFENSDISYIGINFHIRYCMECGEVLAENESKCPKCGSSKIQGVSRVTGYLALDQRFGPGKDAERRDRVSHNDGNKRTYTSIYGE